MKRNEGLFVAYLVWGIAGMCLGVVVAKITHWWPQAVWLCTALGIITRAAVGKFATNHR